MSAELDTASGERDELRVACLQRAAQQPLGEIQRRAEVLEPPLVLSVLRRAAASHDTPSRPCICGSGARLLVPVAAEGEPMPLEAGQDERSDDSRASPRAAWSEWIRPALPWLLGGVPISAAIIRVLVATRFDPTTLSAVITSVDPFTLVVDSAAGLAMALFAFAPLWFLFARAVTGRQSQAMLVGASVSAVVIVLVMPWPSVLVLLLLGGFLWWTGAFSAVSSAPVSTTGFAIGMIGGVLLFASTFGGPREIIEWNDDERAIGFVVADDGQWMTLLRDSDRRVVRIRARDVASRQVCEQDGEDVPSVLQVLGVLARATYPSC